MNKILILIIATIISPSLYAVDEKACSIWLCLPVGFPSGCGDAKKEFRRRIRKGKSPLPSLSSCIISSKFPVSDSVGKPSVMTSRSGFGALIDDHTICKRWEYRHHGKDSYKVCVLHEFIPAHVQHGVTCRIIGKEGYRTPKYCSKTVRFIQTFMDGVQYGETYYFDSSGNTIHVSH